MKPPRRESPSAWAVLKEAALAPANVMGLAATTVGSVLWDSFVPLFVGVGVEVVYLAAYRPLSRLLSGRAHPSREVEAMLAELAPSQREHYFALRELRDRIQTNYRKLPGGSVLAGSSEQRVDALLTAFVRMLATLNSYRAYLNVADRAAVERELKELHEDSQGEGHERLREVKKRRIDILEKRVERFVKAEESREVLSHQLAGIEDLLRLTHEQSIALRDPESVERQLQVLSTELESTQETVREMERFLDLSEDSLAPVPHGTRVR